MSLDLAPQRSDSDLAALDIHLDDLSIDVFGIDGGGLTVESLSGGHSMTDTGASGG